MSDSADMISEVCSRHDCHTALLLTLDTTCVLAHLDAVVDLVNVVRAKLAAQGQLHLIIQHTGGVRMTAKKVFLTKIDLPEALRG